MTTDVTGFFARGCAADRVALPGGLVHGHRPLTGRALPPPAGPRRVAAFRAAAVARSVLAGDLDPEQITEGEFARRLPLPDLPDVDLLWRTGAEQRTSNFLPWHSTYAELFFTTASGQTSTAATCGMPSPNMRDGDAVTARPSADLSANVGGRRIQ